ncbi:NAD(P)H-hydrate dehydratase [Caenimonas sedimenti]|uniref:Bifunctional NAD(P)H-hydrate repair enzyme n=1 Tax=Caenimonas sedimenti TaxID=2596921 RepID=A0A562ZU53_9BURK|nr:NAD(P)H-hydrate dehydratase [Caenimonas sedimenti]TWO71664.1 NAD(P)H-hydrate dehydratase [Caenimonas sedimenti]
MLRVTPDRPWPLQDTAAIRRIEQAAAAALPPHTLMQRAGLSVARLALAVAPHARTVWVACGPGNNGGDGFEAALHLKQWGKEVIVTLAGDPSRAPEDARRSLERARDAGVVFGAAPPTWDFAVDALLGIGASRTAEGLLLECIRGLNDSGAGVLAVDVPSGLNADTGVGVTHVSATHTVSLVALKPGLFTAGGRDAAGSIWVDDLGITAPDGGCTARLVAPPALRHRPHASHKGTHGDVAVIGGAPGMTGAALLAARAALHHGAGRVFVGLLASGAPPLDAGQPDLMVRDTASLALAHAAVACGCGGGDAVRDLLPRVLGESRDLVLDADALNAIASDSQLQALLEARGRRGRPTVLTPHPLEAARLLGTGTGRVQGNRLTAARQLADRFGCTVVLKGSGTVVADAAGTWINPTGNAKLAIAGTGDVLAGMIAAHLAAGASAADAACASVYLHGQAADRWPADVPLTAAALAAAG